MLEKILKLSHVPRWSIVDMLKEQSVADHTFRTQAIAYELIERLGITAEILELERKSNILGEILFHDMEEARTGDIPSNHKNGNTFERANVEHHKTWVLVLQMADTLEAAIWLARYGVRPAKVNRYLERKIIVLQEVLAERLNKQPVELTDILDDILEIGRSYD